MSTKKSGGSGTTGGGVPSGATAGTSQRNKKQKVTNYMLPQSTISENKDLEVLYISTILGKILNIGQNQSFKGVSHRIFREQGLPKKLGGCPCS